MLTFSKWLHSFICNKQMKQQQCYGQHEMLSKQLTGPTVRMQSCLFGAPWPVILRNLFSSRNTSVQQLLVKSKKFLAQPFDSMVDLWLDMVDYALGWHSLQLPAPSCQLTLHTKQTCHKHMTSSILATSNAHAYWITTKHHIRVGGLERTGLEG